eukprot:418544-Pleurochrysis_carterae.AAC.1
MHIRHRSIDRSVIKLYDAQTFTDKVAADDVEGAKTAVRITRRLLQQLADACPHIDMPSTVPPTHSDLALSGRRSGGRGLAEACGRGG